jgi:hypothetical protein
MLKIYNIIKLLIALYYILVLWKIAIKADKPGYSLFIPIISNFTWPQVLKLEPIWCLLSFVPSIATRIYSGNYGIILLSSLLSLAILIYYQYMLAKRFRKRILFTIGLIFLNPIFLGILAFSKKSVYTHWDY